MNGICISLWCLIVACINKLQCVVCLQSQSAGLRQWMEDMDVFLHTEDPAPEDVATLEAQLHESNVSHNT